MTEIRFTVPGVLPGWQRAGKSGKRHFTQAQTAGAESELAAWARQTMAGRPMLKGEVGLRIISGRPMPKGWSISKRREAVERGMALPMVKPDWDNLGKLVDAFNGVVVTDDAQIVDGRVIKVYMHDPKTHFRLWELSADYKACLAAEADHFNVAGK